MTRSYMQTEIVFWRIPSAYSSFSSGLIKTTPATIATYNSIEIQPVENTLYSVLAEASARYSPKSKSSRKNCGFIAGI